MKSHYFSFFNYFIFVCLIFTSCSNNVYSDDELLKLKIKTAESLPIADVLDQLLIQSQNDIELISRITTASPSTIERIRNYETYATPSAEKEFRTLLKNCYIHGDYYLMRQDPEIKWFEKIKLFIDSIKIWQYILVMVIIGFILGLFILQIVVYVDLGVIIIIFLLRFVIYHVFNFFTSKPAFEDNFTNSIDIIWETLK